MVNEKLTILNIGDISTIAERLRSINAEEKWSGNQTIFTFDWSDDFYRKQDILIYLTQAAGYSKLAVHTDYSSTYDCKVHEIAIGNDYEQAYTALTAIGFLPYTKVDTIHYDFVYRDLSIQLNKFPKVPAFMEITGGSIPLSFLISTLKLRDYIICELETQKIHTKYGVNYFEAYHI